MTIEVQGESVKTNYYIVDWEMYKQTLFHLVRNALKFRKPNPNNITEKTVIIKVI